MIYRDDNGDGNIYLCNRNGETFANPVIMNEQIDSKFWEPSACLSSDERTLYFVSNRKGGFGGRDIYMCKLLPSGEWGKPQNMGKPINTEFDEDAPFLQGDGKTLYFCSNGHKTMGGFDIFYSTLDQNNEWGEPVNAGYPINTTGDDLFYQPTPDGKRAYFASVRKEGMGDKDIYIASYPDAQETALTMIKGTVSTDTLKMGSAISITVIDQQTGETVGIYNPNKKTGKYLMLLPSGKTYRIIASSDNKTLYSDTLDVATDNKFMELEKNISLRNVSVIDEQKKKMSEEQETIPTKKKILNTPKIPDNKNYDTLQFKRNIKHGDEFRSTLYFLMNEHRLTEKHKTQLDSAFDFFNANAESLIRIMGHTDSISSDGYNWHLSQLRALEAAKYLKDKGLHPSRIKTECYGDKMPVLDNGTYFGRSRNRRVVIQNIPSKKN
jgi:outer membrane protein OmpA-like peptidoglycan-associated protein